MAHYAFLDENNIVVEVIVGKDETDTSENWETFYGNLRGLTCKRTSYNTVAGTHKVSGSGFRGNYAGVGFKYDSTLDAFYPPQPYNSWTFNSSSYSWECPVDYPSGSYPGQYNWDEDNTQWVTGSI